MKCKICGHGVFKPDSGYFYCTTCGTQGEQQLEYEQNFELIELQNRTRIKTAPKETNRLTSWEEYNYILLGLVNELIDLGAKDELKMTALQLWTTYLRVNEVAFFSRRELKIPKLGASFKAKDADILYNLKRIKRSKQRTRSGGVSDGQSSLSEYSRRNFKKQQSNLALSEYEALQSERDLNASLSIANQSLHSSDGSSSISSNQSQNIRLEFSRISRRILKKTMSKKHLQKHVDNGAMECHKFQRKHCIRPVPYATEVVSRSMMFEILYLALNQIGDDIQMGDIIRYIREGHLTFMNVLKFFPENVQNQKLQHNFKGSATAFPSHHYFRYVADIQRQLLHVELKMPDLVKLTKRYVDELSLPMDVHTIIDTLLVVCPPEMTAQTSATHKMPNYEGRAIALILFVVKLLFGLDDERERKMSKSAQTINQKLRDLKSDSKMLFVWDDYVKFIEMRNVLLADCHYPTARKVHPDAEDNASLFCDFLRNNITEDDVKSNMRPKMVNFEAIFKKAKELHPIENGRQSLQFEPSLTPKRSYLERLLSDPSVSTNTAIPEFMNEDISAFDINPYLNPSELRRNFRKFGISLNVERLSCTERFSFNRVFMRYFPDVSNVIASGVSCMSYDFDISHEDWLAENKLKENKNQIMLDAENSNQNIIILSHLANNQEIHRSQKKIKKAELTSSKGIKNTAQSVFDETFDDNQSQVSSILASVREQFEPSFRIEETVPLFDCVFTDDEYDMYSDNSTESLDLLVNSNEYWLCMGYQNELRKRSFSMLLRQLPSSFRWMLRQCAHTIQCSEQDVYRELQIIENQYAYVLQSFGQMRNTVLYQKITNRTHVPGLNRLSKSLRRYW